jgi:hypothetical protein
MQKYRSIAKRWICGYVDMSNNDVNTSIAYVLETRREKESRDETYKTQRQGSNPIEYELLC